MTGAAVAKPLLKMKLRLAAVKALREAVLNNLGRTIDATAEFSQLVVEAEIEKSPGPGIIRFCATGRVAGEGWMLIGQ